MLVLGLLAGVTSAAATDEYWLPPKQLTEMLDAEPLPKAIASPDGAWLLLYRRKSLVGIDELAAPVLQLAHHQINPRTNGSDTVPRTHGVGLTLVRVADQKEWQLDVPSGRLGEPLWAPDSQHLVFLRHADQGVELWLASVASKSARQLTKPEINAARNPTDVPCAWLFDSRRVLCQMIPKGRGRPPQRPSAPEHPNVQETGDDAGDVALVPGGLLQNEYDEALYDYYMTSQPVLLDIGTGERRAVGEPGIYESLKPSPNSQYLLSVRIVPPYSYFVTDAGFPKEVEILALDGKRIRSIQKLASDDSGSARRGWAPRGGRRYSWIPGMDATLSYIMALDDGDPRHDVPYRDRLVKLDAPFTADPVELIKTRSRIAPLPDGVSWSSSVGNLAWGHNGLAWVEEFDWRSQRKRAWLVDARDTHLKPVLLWEFRADDDYSHPGKPMFYLNDRGEKVFRQKGDWIYLLGLGSSVQGDRPFLDRLNWKTQRRETLFQSAGKNYEQVVALLDDDGHQVLTQYETPEVPPNYYLRNLRSKTCRAVTAIEHPVPELARIKSERIHYTRADGVSLAGDLYLPVDYVRGRRLPVVIWAYPREYESKEEASQHRGSKYRFSLSAQKPLKLIVVLLVTQGYAVLMDASMPTTGGSTANDTAVEQMTANAKAAVDAMQAMGIADRSRVGIAGHSYGAVMSATLLANTDLFAAGVALSGAYDLAATPFGFQDERRTIWEAPDVYRRLSAVMNADRIRAPLLLVHGELDHNYAANPEQSRQMFRALKGLKKQGRLVMLPYEGHVYSARESVLHVAWEMSNWFERYLKRSGSER